MRNSKIDAAKGVLILLVVLGHYMETLSLWSHPVFGVVLGLMYAFHMPAFAFLAGATAKFNHVGRRLMALGITLALFQLAYVGPILLRTGVYPIDPLQPYWILWFLLSLMWWIALTPLLLTTRFPVVLACMLALACGAVTSIGYPLSLSRTFVFLPFFVAGHLHGARVLETTLPFPKSVAILAFALAALLIAWIGVDRRLLYGAFSYAALQLSPGQGALVRAAFILCASMLMLAFFRLLPERKNLMSKIGQASLAIFLLHGFFVKASSKMLTKASLGSPLLTAALLLSVSALTVCLLALPALTKLIRAIPEKIFAIFQSA